MEYALITPAEADATLDQHDDWLALTDSAKEAHIAKASVYVQTQWVCTDVDWTGTIPDIIKTAVAFYALSDMGGNLYGDPSETIEYHGSLKSKSEKLGPLEEEVSYFRGGGQHPSGVGRSNGYPDALMASLCTASSVFSNQLTRV